jgi:hypothetical protein
MPFRTTTLLINLGFVQATRTVLDFSMIVQYVHEYHVLGVVQALQGACSARREICVLLYYLLVVGITPST